MKNWELIALGFVAGVATATIAFSENETPVMRLALIEETGRHACHEVLLKRVKAQVAVVPCDDFKQMGLRYDVEYIDLVKKKDGSWIRSTGEVVRAPTTI